MTAYSNNERKLVSLAKKYTLSRKTVKSKNWNAFKGIKVKFTKKKQKIRQNIAKAIDIKNIFKVLSTTYIKSKVRQVYEATIKDPYSWSKRIIQLTTQQVTSKIPTHVFSKDYQMSRAQTALDAVRATRPWVQSATQNFYYRITQILKKEMIQPVHTLYSKASDERERIPFYVASAKYLREYFQNALYQARKNMANFSNTEIYHTSPYDMFSKKLEYDFDKVACLPPEERNIYYGEWAKHAIESVKVIDEYMEYGGTYHVVQNGRIIREYYENGTQKFEEVSYIPEDRIGGSRELGSAFEETPIWYVDYFSTGSAIKNTLKKLGKNAFIRFNKGTDEISEIVKQGQKMPKHIEVKNKTNLPGKGEPNSSADLLNPDGTVKQRRYYDENGRAKEDIDFNHSDDGTHTFPHRHKWDWSKKHPRQKPE
ncbi:hypothetical protein [Bacillus alkalicellulosilyticus]|uniref:hypothetical protein n=1 Tax=Alkalihalobacterium alkalicellulosilyticum TaxID=1912214 RepID=UPI001FE67B0F|nr:hypothetical protein [Bacillus alkalicellulosilyticus]